MSADKIEVDGFINDLHAMQQRFDQYIVEQKESVLEKRKQYLAASAVDKENLKSLERQYESYTSKENENTEAAKKYRQELERLELELSDLESQKHQLSSRKDTFQAQINDLAAKIEKEMDVLRKVESTKDSRKHEAAKGLEYYRERLGLKFAKEPAGFLRFIFNNIDLDNGSREFWFALEVDKNDLYQLKDCEPAVKGTQELLDSLNKDNNFSAFLKSMRVKFQETCK